jgi:prepilin-type N-terminal cleavage/methylation domain-containing protein
MDKPQIDECRLTNVEVTVGRAVCRPLSTLRHSAVRHSSICGFSNLRSGFTVIELVGVLAILAILLASIVGAYLGWGQAGAVDGAANMVVSSLARARELAITRRDTTGMVCGNTAIPGHAARGFFVLFTNSVDQAISPTNYLPGDVQFVLDEGGQQSILFTTEGRALTRDAEGDAAFVGLVSPRGGRPLQRYIYVDPLTGIASVMQVAQ